jgi:hypothetical protein
MLFNNAHREDCTCCQFKLTPLLQVEAFKGGFFTGVSMSKAPGPGKMSDLHFED